LPFLPTLAKIGLVIYIFYGQDSFSLREALTSLQERLAEESPFPLQVDHIEGARATPAEVINTCRTAPFLGSYRLVVVEGLLSQFNPPERASRRRSGPSDIGPWQALVEAAEGIPPSTVLVLVDGEVSPQNPLLRALAPKAQVRAFRPLSPAALPGWIRERARRLGATFTPGALRLLAEAVGNNLWALAGEIEKLATYAAGNPITEDDVRALVAASREAELFPLVDAVVEGRRGPALRLLRRLKAAGIEGTHLLALLARQYRFLLLAQEAGGQGLSLEEVAQELGLSSPFTAEKLLGQASRYPRQRLVEAYRRLLAADVAIKRGIHSEEVALDLLVGELAEGTRAAALPA